MANYTAKSSTSRTDVRVRIIRALLTGMNLKFNFWQMDYSDGISLSVKRAPKALRDVLAAQADRVYPGKTGVRYQFLVQ